MFELKKYQIKKAFGGYQKGALVAFNGKDAEKYKDFIVCAEKEVKPTTEAQEEKKVKKVKRGKK